MSRAQTGVSPLLPKNTLIISFRVRDIPLSAMSVGHVAANIPGLANEFRKSASDSDLVYTIGFGWQLWNFIWQGALPPGFSHLENHDGTEDEIDEDDDEDSGPTLLFCFSASQPDILHALAEQSQIHLKNIADVHDMTLGESIECPSLKPVHETKAAKALIGNNFPEYAESSYLLNLRLDSDDNSKWSTAEKKIRNERFARDFHTLTENEPGLIHHLYSQQSPADAGNHLMAYCDHVNPFQRVLDRLATPHALQAPWEVIKCTPSLYFLPSLEILAGLRMGTLRMGPLSPTARWK
jgi:porphyrinogen peroxidase